MRAGERIKEIRTRLGITTREVEEHSRAVAEAEGNDAYLPDSTEGFLHAEDLANIMKEAGFNNVRFRYKMFNTIAIHYGERRV